MPTAAVCEREDGGSEPALAAGRMPAAGRPADVLMLQRGAGNRATMVALSAAALSRGLARCPDCAGMCRGSTTESREENEGQRLLWEAVLARRPRRAERQLQRQTSNEPGPRADALPTPPTRSARSAPKRNRGTEAGAPVSLALQRNASNRAVGRTLARSGSRGRMLARWRIKQHLDSPDLDNDRLQEAITSADHALNVGIDNGQSVTLLQAALRKLGYDAPDTGVYDAQTQTAVAAFQAKEGIPYPTGRQAGPKTLSTLDDELLGLIKPDPPKPRPKDCAQYEGDERMKSITSRGRSMRSGTLGKVLTLSNFAAGRSRMKEDHEKAVDQLITDFSLFEPESDWEIEFIRGFTDSVDAEDRNAVLREARAADVRFYFQHHGVPNAPDEQAADVNSYDPGCTPDTRTAARRVVVQLRKRKPTPKKPCDPQRVENAKKAIAAAGTARAAAQARLDRADHDELIVTIAEMGCGMTPVDKPHADECFKALRPEQRRVAKELRESGSAIRVADADMAHARAELDAAEHDLC